MSDIIHILIDKFKILADEYYKVRDFWRFRSYNKVVGQLKAFAQTEESKKFLDDIVPKIPKFPTREKYEDFRGGSKPKEWTKEFKVLANSMKKDFKNANVSGVGDGIVGKIIEWFATGEIKKVGEMEEFGKEFKKKRPKKDQIIDSFMWNNDPSGIWGVGKVKATQLYDKGYREINDINPDELTDQQKIGLKYYKQLRNPIKREYITIFKNVMKYVLDKEFGKGTYKLKIAGSYRRHKPTSGDIDCLMTSKKFTLEEMVDALMKWDIVTDILSMRGEKFMGVAHCPSQDDDHFRLDIEFVEDYEWFPALIYFTGSKQFNTDMRLEAKKKKYHLDQHGLYKKLSDEDSKQAAKDYGFDLSKWNNQNVKKLARSAGFALTTDGLFQIVQPINSEQDIFDILGMNYLIPRFR